MDTPTPYSTVRDADGENIMTLWRGTVAPTAQRIAQFMTADGYDTSATPGLTPGAPTDNEAIQQVMGFSGQNPRLLPKFPEYTCNQGIALGFATGAVVCIKIKRKYLTAGSVSEQGWVAYHEAPVEKVVWEPRTSANGSATGLLNNKTGKRIFAD